MQNFSGGRYDGQAADVWACGVCLFIMLFGRHPYLRPSDEKLNEQQQMIKLFQRMMQASRVMQCKCSSPASVPVAHALSQSLHDQGPCDHFFWIANPSSNCTL
jgi:serine/threonine protein kinase